MFVKKSNRDYLNIEPNGLILKTTHLLYRVDIELKKQEISNIWKLEARGSLRVGPKRAYLDALSEFNSKHQCWDFGRYIVKKFSIEEQFERKGNYVVRKGTNEKEIPFDPTLEEPIGFLFKLYTQYNQDFRVRLILGGKVREVCIEKKEIYIAGKKWAQLQKTSKGLGIQIPRLKISLELIPSYLRTDP